MDAPTTGRPRHPSVRRRNAVPSAAPTMIPVSQSRWATQSGAPSCSNPQNHGPIGHR